MLVRYFAAACAAPGVQEEHSDLPEGTFFEELIAAKLSVERSDGYSADTPSLAGVIPQRSFLRNEVALRDRFAALRPGMSLTSCRHSRADSASATELSEDLIPVDTAAAVEGGEARTMGN